MADWSWSQGKILTAGGLTTINVGLTSLVANGHNLVGAVLLDTGATITNLTDDKGNAYTVFDEHDGGTLYIAAFRSNGFLINAPQTLTFTASPATADQWFVVDEFAPPTGSTALSVDGSSMTTNSAGSSFTSFNTSLPDDLVYAVSMSNGISTHGAGFNAASGDGTARCSEWGIQAAAGTVTMNLATQTISFWGPAFALNAGGAGAGQTFAGARQLVMM